MALDTAEGYILPHDSPESKRLSLQHEAFVSSVGFIPYPRFLHLLPLSPCSLA